ncbi:MAG: 16S rRNA (cytidine(1402)-2'-O)-methyltransferase [Chloroflexi bacterium]|nr:16S rRNA (cytidine(1402)-2'-O)-methyltransferase [Chloroflexota bacterium]
MGSLFVVGTPIGNLEDITFRAVRTLREVSLIAAEDTRTSRVLLRAHGIDTPLTSFHEFTGPRKVQRLVETLQDRDVALISDAGMPGVSDPGFPLIRAALEAGLAVVPIPGPSAVLASLVASGLPMHAFHFVGFLPRKPGERRRTWAAVAHEDATLVAFESPHRLAASLQDAFDVLGNRAAAVCREMTKKFEEVRRLPLEELAQHYWTVTPRGEFTIVVEGRPKRGHGPEN